MPQKHRCTQPVWQTLLDQLFSGRRPRRTLRRSSPARLSVECLEDRILPAPMIVSVATGNGPVSIYDALSRARMETQQGLTGIINFDPSLNGKTIDISILRLELSPQLDGNGTIIFNGRGQITLDAGSTKNGVIVDAGASAIFNGLTIEGVSDPSNSGAIQNGGTLTLNDCTLSNNTGLLGGALDNEITEFGVLPTLTLNNCTVSDNTAGAGGGIYSSGGTLTLNNCTVSANSATRTVADSALSQGGGIYSSGCMVTLNDCTVSGNTASQGGGIDCSGGTLTMQSCTLSANTASAAGGIGNNGTMMTLTDCTLSRNAANGADLSVWCNNGVGGGIENAGQSTLTDCSFSGNSAAAGGGGIENDSQGQLALIDCTLSGNSAGSGGGIDNGKGTLTVSASTFLSNTATSVAGGM